MRLVGKAALLFALWAHPLLAPPAFDANAFSAAYNEWVHLVEERHQHGALDAAELRAWQRTKLAWRDFSKVIDNEY